MQGQGTVILCEALLDALTFWVAGFRNVTAVYGAEGFTGDHEVALKKSGAQRILIAYDRDEAGDRAASALAERLISEGLECYRVQFPRGLDANAYALKVQPAPKSLAVALRQAVWMGKGPSRPLPAVELSPVAEVFTASVPSTFPLAAEQRPSAEEIKIGPSSVVEQVAAEPRRAPPAPLAAASAQPAAPVQSAALPVEPAMPKAVEVPTEVNGEEVVVLLGERRYRVRGLPKAMAFDSLKVNLLASRGDGFHVDTLEMYSARQRAAYVKQAAAELGLDEEVVKRDVGQVLLKLEALQEAQIKEALEPKPKTAAMSDAEREVALELLKSPRLLERVLKDFEACGVVGEENNKLMGYLAAVSRKLEAPLAVIVQSSTAAGKSSLMEAVLAFTTRPSVGTSSPSRC